MLRAFLKVGLLLQFALVLFAELGCSDWVGVGRAREVPAHSPPCGLSLVTGEGWALGRTVWVGKRERGRGAETHQDAARGGGGVSAQPVLWGDPVLGVQAQASHSPEPFSLSSCSLSCPHRHTFPTSGTFQLILVRLKVTRDQRVQLGGELRLCLSLLAG